MKSEPGEIRVGQILKKRRQALHLGLTQIEVATKIRGKFLIKLESGDYAGLGHDIYTKGFVRTYADYLGLDGRTLAKQYLAERGTLPVSAVKLERPRRRRRAITPRIAFGLVSVLMVGLVVAYLGWQVQALAAPPKLVVTQPVGDEVVEGSLVNISGQADSGSDVAVNDSPVLTDANGNFNDQLALQNGLNTITVTAKSKLGRTSTVTRNILAHNPTAAPTTTPPSTVAGVQVQVIIKGSATWLVIDVDNKEAFRGTMLAGTTQSFSGNSQIIVSTGNAGATSLVVTNPIAAGKTIPSLGTNGQVRRNFQFTTTTVIP